MPMVEHPQHGLYFDECHAPTFKVRLVLALALLVSMALWMALIFAGVALYRFLRGGA